MGGADAHRGQFTLLPDGRYKALYPELDFSRVGFYSGLPSVISLAGPDGFTMASGAASPDIRVYIKDYEPCGQDTFLDIAHELVHVIQIQGMLGGGRIPGSWTAYYTSQTLNCTRGWSTCYNGLEKEAYDFANGLSPSNCGAEGKVRDFVDTVGVRSLATAPVSPGRSPTLSAGRPMPRRCRPPVSSRPRATSEGPGALCSPGRHP